VVLKQWAILRFWRKNDQGQDIAEYCLLTALIALIAFGVFYHMSGGIQDLWGTANSTLVATSTVSTASATGTATASTPAN
jgi:Flp pilus assembly pilin Flp